MKRRNLATILVILLLMVSSVGVKAQSILGINETDGSLPALNAVETNVLFGYSEFSLNNVLVLNGTPVQNINCGWFSDTGLHSNVNKNYACGREPNISSEYYRNFFVFDLTDLASLGITPPIISAVLRVDRYQPFPQTGSQYWELYSVTTPFNLFLTSYSIGSAQGINIFNDLGDGDFIGNVIVDRSLSYTPQVEVVLNSAGLAAINSSVGDHFILGGIAGDIIPVPVPIWIIALGFLLIAGVVVLRFRKKRQLA